jgi:hypothetical protein
MTTYSNLKYDHPFSSNATGTGSLTLISSQTASASANISFTSGIDSTYDEYVFKIINAHPSSDSATLTFNMSTDGGSNYNVTKTSSFFKAYHDEADTATDLTYRTSQDLAQSTAYQEIEQDIGADNDQSYSGTLHLFSPSSTTYVKHYILYGNSAHSGNYSMNPYCAGYGNTTSAINAVDFKFNTGNIDDGTILMYGVK